MQLRGVGLGSADITAQSNKTDRHGRITKRGSRLLRTMLVECAWAALRYNAWAQAVYERIHGGQKSPSTTTNTEHKA